MLSDELPIDTSAAHQEAAQVAAHISGAMRNITYCTPVSCLKSDGKMTPWKDLKDPSKRLENMTYCRLLCDINGPEFDFHIAHAGSNSLVYCLQFPNHLYDPSTHILLDAGTTAKKKVGIFR